MADTKTDASSTPLSDDPVFPTNGGLSAKAITASHPAGAEPALDTLFHRPLRLRIQQGRSPLLTLSFIERLAILLRGQPDDKRAARTHQPYRVSSNRLLDGVPVQPTLMVYTMAYTDG